ncbi:M61 family metallopeptidase [Maribacter cobaltidurans]|uniref:Peptidase M61 n=1 Tax=Maribacter cobaltidurans TaxID=1178778 RepID=A0A223V2H2_9FLAO|nr:peptidase M61 [Maribacter cobaltidurans]ASV29522.1 peptidase M61 [Maribacter cobaltidurans]GGD68324.1 peptidase M61 [Maribacter cobaltidurans]
MKKAFLHLLVALFLYGCGASKNLSTIDKSPLVVSMDLVNVVDDQVKVTIDPGAFTANQISFRIPKTVPGTYSSDDYGQYVEGFVAYDYSGNPLEVSKQDQNTWTISNATKLDKISYMVNDTYDTENEVEDAVFSPAGTNIKKGSNYMLNLHGFVGYFDGYKEIPYQLTIQKPVGFEAATSLTKTSLADEGNGDVFLANRYFEVIDNPIFYTKPDKEVFKVGSIEVTLSVFSPNGTYHASDLKERMESMMTAQKAFLGDINTTNKYNILLYLSTMEDTDAKGFGALEHHTSTVVVLPEAMPKERLEQAMVDVVSHEFFHIVTPLSVHSNEIHYFDYNAPKMSQHLWMYEGTTEYFANLFQVHEGLIDEAEFYERMRQKMANAKAYDDTMSFTVMSKNILEAPYESNYANVYEKGALINMALDILIREKSNGERGVLWLMKQLSKKYGVNTPFKDDQLIDEIVALTYPEVQDFFNEHVIGDTPIDYAMYLEKMGLSMAKVEEQTGYFLQGEIPYIDVDQSAGDAIFVRKGIELNSFFTSLGVQGGDVIKSINGTDINLESIRPIIGQSFGWTPDTTISMELERDGETITVEGSVGKPTIVVNKITPMEDGSSEVQKLRNDWLKN